MTPPEKIPWLVRRSIPPVEVPADAAEAKKVLVELYHAGQDKVISASFPRFAAVLSTIPGGLDVAYMAEILGSTTSHTMSCGCEKASKRCETQSGGERCIRLPFFTARATGGSARAREGQGLVPSRPRWHGRTGVLRSCGAVLQEPWDDIAAPRG